MAHEVEQMMYVGNAPWHNLGQRFVTAPTLDEAIVAAGLDWKVGLKPLYTANGDLIGEEVDHQASFRESDGRILGVVGPSYHPLQNNEAFKFFEPFIDSGLATIETAGSLRNGQRVFILAKIASDDSVIVKQSDDRVAKYVLLSNSHDGTLAVRVGFTPIRVVCNNTMTLAHSDKASKLIRLRHSSNIVQNLENIREIMNLANSEFEATADSFRFLASKEINSVDLAKYVKIVFGKPGQETGGERILGKIIPLFEKGRGNDMAGVKGTYWAAYNAVNEYLQYERGNDDHNRLNSMWFGDSATLNKKALETALVLAAA
jgi:phage/plasmid-like protein (TIGR03299 family)